MTWLPDKKDCFVIALLFVLFFYITVPFLESDQHLKRIQRFVFKEPVYEMKFLDRSLNFTFSNHFHSNICRNITTLIAIPSGPQSFLQRKHVRNTWLIDKLPDQLCLFFVAKSGDPRIDFIVRNESETYGDMILVDFRDSYHNISTKIFTMMKWKQTFCPDAEYYLRTNDDTIVNMTNLRDFTLVESKLQAYDTTKRIYGGLLVQRPAVRDKNYKWYVPESEYNETYYPPYCDGGSCLYTKDAVNAILNKTSEVNYVWVDDVLYGGILAERAKVTRINRGDVFRHMTNEDYFRYKNHTYEPLNFVSVHVDDLDKTLAI